MWTDGRTDVSGAAGLVTVSYVARSGTKIDYEDAVESVANSQASAGPAVVAEIWCELGGFADSRRSAVCETSMAADSGRVAWEG